MAKITFWGLLLWSLGSALTAGEWSQIRERGFLIIGVQSNNPPLASKNENGELVGFEIDLARQLALKLLGSRDKVRLVPLSNTDRLEALWNDRVDMLIAQMTVTGNRQRLVAFSPSYYIDRSVVIHPQARPPRTIDRPRIGVLDQSSNIAVLQNEWPQARPIPLISHQEGFEALLRGKIDGMILDGLGAVTWLRNNPQFVASPTGHFSSLAVALPRGLQHHELRQKTSQTIEALQTQQWLRERAEFWQLNPVK